MALLKTFQLSSHYRYRIFLAIFTHIHTHTVRGSDKVQCKSIRLADAAENQRCRLLQRLNCEGWGSGIFQDDQQSIFKIRVFQEHMMVQLQVVQYFKVNSSLRVQSGGGGDVITGLIERQVSLKYSYKNKISLRPVQRHKIAF